MRRVLGRDVIGNDDQDVSDVTDRDLVLRACDEVLKMRADLAAHTITENEFHAKFGKVFVDLGTLFGRVDKIEKGYRRHSTSLLPPMRAPLDSSGDRIELKVLSTKQRGTAYLDVIREGQTVLTRDVDIINGQAELTLTATADLAGALDFNAYLFGSNARPVADHRLAFVQPADELKIEASADAAEYRPGGEARIQFRVTDAKGQGVQAALGLQVVDEAVFALAEKQPGFAKVFFYLEQEVMKPRYEIHSIGMPEVVTSAGRAGPRD